MAGSSSSNLKLIEVKPDGLLGLVDEILWFTWLAIVNQSQSIKSSNLTVGHTGPEERKTVFHHLNATTPGDTRLGRELILCL
jgi:hypothetical protein